MEPAQTQSKEIRKRKAALLVNLAVVVLELVALVLASTEHGQGWHMFRYYTEDSNTFAALACGACAACQFRQLHSGAEIPRFARVLKYMAACCLTLTFVVVICVLGPLDSRAGENGYYHLLFSGLSSFSMHLLCPALVVGSFLFLEAGPSLERRTILFAMLPTLVYAVIAIILNALRVMVGPYPFLQIYKQPFYATVLWALILLVGAGVLAWLVWRLKKQRLSRAAE